MKDFYEIMDYCGFDLDRASRMADLYSAAIEETLTDAGLEVLQPKSDCREPRRGLRRPGDLPRYREKLV